MQMNTPNDADKIAEAFIRWPLPESVCADLCATKQGPGRIGTNLLSFIEAKQMAEDIILPALAAKDAEIRRLRGEEAHVVLVDDKALEAENATLKAEVARLRAALAVYADKANWEDKLTGSDGGDEEVTLMLNDETHMCGADGHGWQLAAEVLEKKALAP